jgi:Na+-transporting methylmalonyl-CoA/oxaloacetate decarboxylase gamma subunit
VETARSQVFALASGMSSPNVGSLRKTSPCSVRSTALKMRHLFEAASKIPRSQQEKIAAVIEAVVNQHSDRET